MNSMNTMLFETKDYNSISELNRIEVVENDPSAIQYFKTPSEAVQLAAVECDPNAIRYIRNPTEKVQLAAVEIDFFVIKYIKQPTNKVQLASIQYNTNIIQYIKDPSLEVQLAAINRDPYVIRHIKNPSETIQEYAITLEGVHIFESINNISQNLLSKYKDRIIKYILIQIKNSNISFITGLIVNLQKYTDWKELTIIQNSIDADKR